MRRWGWSGRFCRGALFGCFLDGCWFNLPWACRRNILDVQGKGLGSVVVFAKVFV